MAVMLLNSQGLITVNDPTGNENLVLKAASYGIKLDINDLVSGYDVKKVDRNGNNIFEIMTSAKDIDILHFKELISKINQLKIIPNLKERILKLALDCDFAELLEILYENKEELYSKQGHILAKN